MNEFSHLIMSLSYVPTDPCIPDVLRKAAARIEELEEKENAAWVAEMEKRVEAEAHIKVLEDTKRADFERIEYLETEIREADSRIKVLEDALHWISLASQNSGTTKEDLGRHARAALASGKDKTDDPPQGSQHTDQP